MPTPAPALSVVATPSIGSPTTSMSGWPVPAPRGRGPEAPRAEAKANLTSCSKLVEVTAAGATVNEPAHDVGGGRLVATVTDPDGNVLGLLQDR